MAYRSDFYKPENIIGYTGNIKVNPTVYFRTGQKPGIQEYGHITQAHDMGKRLTKTGQVLTEGANVGREEVRSSTTYEMKAAADGALEEWDNGQCIHPSRNAFISAANLDHRAKFLLSCAIARYTEKKQWGDYSAVQQVQIARYGYLKNSKI